MLEVIPSVDSRALNAGLKKLKTLDEDVIKDLRRNLVATIGPYAAKIAEAVPTQAPLSGMNNNGATQWARVKGTVNLTPGRSKKTGNHLLSIRVTPAKERRGVYIGEMAGMRSNGKSRRGANLINVLNQRFPMIKRGGRFAFDKFRKTRPEFVKLAVKSVKKTTDKINKDLVR